ncbi:MAG: glycosyltransferase family 2 protein [Candidatus Caenarcaniphilales bacterium]|nr:glycosyltransferase family 2 protein [Candidatus Caenarcaniphilales bacterium]
MILLIPAFNPDFKLLQLVDELIKFDVEKIIIVNDGSFPSSDGVFGKLRLYPQCLVLNHKQNMGKGKALKSGFKYIHDNFPNTGGLVTIDCDGQHKPQDIKKVLQKLSSVSNSLVLGSRRVGRQMPWKSLIGNLFSRFLLFGITGKWLADTQTGLRGIPNQLIPELLKINGNGFEYEFNSLISLSKAKVNFIEVGIQTIYIEKNKSSHFLPISDSLKIFVSALKSFVNYPF